MSSAQARTCRCLLPFLGTLLCTPARAQAPAPTVTFVPGTSVKIEQVIGDEDSKTKVPTVSRTLTRYKVLGTDLGQSFEANGKLVFLFGDTITQDPNIVNAGAGDTFASSTSTDGDAGLLVDFYTTATGAPLFIRPPGIKMGAFEVPNGGIGLPSGFYIVCTTNVDRNLPDPHVNASSVLTRFNEATRTFTTGRVISQMPAGHFVIQSLHAFGSDVLAFGLGRYRGSDVYLATTPAATFETGVGTQYFAGLDGAGQPVWAASEALAVPLVQDNPLNGPPWPNDQPTIGDVSVTYSADLGLWLMTYDGGRQSQQTIGVYFTYARQPWGPWSAPQKIFGSGDGVGQFIHDPSILPNPPGDGLNGPTIGGNDPYTTRGGAYAPYMIERFTKVAGDRLKIYWVVSTWNPYTVVLMRSEFAISDNDGLSDDWEQRFGLQPASSLGDDGPDGDPDRDGLTNAEEFAAGTHPRGFHTRYFAEGATSSFFDTSLAILNIDATQASVLLQFQKGDGTTVSYPLTVQGHSRATVAVKGVAGMTSAEFSTVIESDAELVVDRTMTWDATGFGSHAETSVPAPATTWYLAEGATHSGFQLFYLLQNPNGSTVTARVRYLLPAGDPVTIDYALPARSRFNIWVNGQHARLGAVDVSAVITSDLPIIVERAMYLSRDGVFVTGHESAGITQPATEWFLAEGATGTFFDLFVLVANPGNAPAEVQATFLLPGGASLIKTYTVAANSRFNIWVDAEDPRLVDTAVSTVVTSTNGVPIIVERAMWWPGPTAATWYEAHNSAGVTSTAARWALADGETGGPRSVETYILIANRGPADTAHVTLFYEDGGQDSQVFPLAATSRTNVAVGFDFPHSAGRRFGAIIETGSGNPQIVVERAMYSNANGFVWAAGTNAVATKIQ